MNNEDAIEIIETFRLIFDSPEVENKEVLLGAIDKAIEALKDERPHGEWVDTGDMQEYWAEEYRCSICGAKDHWHNFCPNCGADMRGMDNEC